MLLFGRDIGNVCITCIQIKIQNSFAIPVKVKNWNNSLPTGAIGFISTSYESNYRIGPCQIVKFSNWHSLY